jgi:hypothetical protein
MQPIAAAVGNDGSARNCRHLVAEAKALWQNISEGVARRCGRRVSIW